MKAVRLYQPEKTLLPHGYSTGTYLSCRKAAGSGRVAEAAYSSW